MWSETRAPARPPVRVVQLHLRMQRVSESAAPLS